MKPLPPGPELARHNRRIVAARSNWPPGALETCVRLEREHPAWRVWWMQANTIPGWERPAGFSASRDDVSLLGGDELRRHPEDGVARRPNVFGPTVAELLVRIAAMEKRIKKQRTIERQMFRWARARP